MLRDCIRNEIFEALNYDIFRNEDFVISENDDKKSIVKIQYNDYYYIMEFQGHSSSCQVVNSPGIALIEDSFTTSVTSMKFVIMNIHEWLERIKNDMLNPVERRFVDNSIQKFREEVESKLEKIEDGCFTKAEGDELKERLV